ncbi:MAG: DUF4089 domain-containing protein [Leptolyngbyaceae cyanobacterium SL_1_1]|nr:DUF4089 domain-containing protein [Leptolyngbyaceae cyanobacterium RM2_2_21]NJN04631.1 DUF4089 domain-containing protein [Leptolyngbyaceae cyanobacterium RM1_1_2]NJO09193.1 DUF4089 domain-containing protein [Leptolyngbyaceae cyanobacterium SL_1_1]
MAQVLDLPIPDDIKASVIENFCQIHAIAQPVIHFSFPDDLEAAPIFKP